MSKTIFDGGTSPIFSFLTPPGSEQNPSASIQGGQEPVIKQRTETSSGKRRTQEKRKTKRLNLLIQPSLHEKLAKIACMKQTSVNAVIIEASKEYCVNEARALEKYERTFGQEAEEV